MTLLRVHPYSDSTEEARTDQVASEGLLLGWHCSELPSELSAASC